MKTDVLNGLLALKLVAEKGTFTAAAGEMGVTTSAVSRTIKQLEKQLNCVLLNRTTRSTSLTELGEQFLRRYQPALEQLLDSLEELGGLTGKPIGTLRLNAPRACWPTVICPILEGFKQAYPEISIELFFQDSLVDIVGGGFDAGIRPSEMTAGDMTAILISPPFRFVIAGSPAYFKRHGTPQHPKDLVHHDCIPYRFDEGHMYKRWEFEEEGRDLSVAVNGRLMVNDSLIMLECARQGLGLIYTTDDLVHESVKRGELAICLEEFAPSSDGYYLYYPNLYQVSPKLRAFIDYIKTQKRGRRSQKRSS